MFFRVTVPLLLVMIVFLPADSSAGLSLDVSPIRIEMTVERAVEQTNAIRIHNSGDEPARLRARPEDWFLDEMGTPIFRPAGTVPQSASPWIQLTPTDFLIEPGQTQYVRFTVNVPETAVDGSYHGCVFLESLPLSRADQSGLKMFIQGSVACMLYVKVGVPSRSAQLTSLEAVERDGRRLIRMQIANTGTDVIRLAGDVLCLVNELSVAEPVLIPDVPVLPGARRWVELVLPENVPVENTLARVTVDLTGVGRLVGECPLAPEQAGLVK